MARTCRGKDTWLVDGKEVSEAEFERLFEEERSKLPKVTGAPTALLGWKPIESDALAVHPRQITEAVADARKKGVATEFLPDGRPVFRSRQHRRAYLKAYGFYDRDGGYGD